MCCVALSSVLSNAEIGAHRRGELVAADGDADATEVVGAAHTRGFGREHRVDLRGLTDGNDNRLRLRRR